MKQNETRLENKTPRETTTALKLEVFSLSQRACQHCKKNIILQNCKPGNFSQQNHMNARLFEE